MSVAEFAAFQRRQGQRVREINGVHWRQVRPLFYRPLLPYLEFPPGSGIPPWAARFGAFQHAVAPAERSNSALNILMFEEPQHYTLSSLDSDHARQVRRAAKAFDVRVIVDLDEFKQKAYPVYLSFYERTRYTYGSERRHRPSFELWAEQLFGTPNVLVIGGYRQRELGGVNVSFLVDDTLMYSSVFCDTESMRLNLSSLLLHSVREAAAAHGGVKRIFTGMHRGNSVDEFYLQRGCTLVRKPAYVRINPLAKLLLLCCGRQWYLKLQGAMPVAGRGAGGEAQFASPARGSSGAREPEVAQRDGSAGCSS